MQNTIRVVLLLLLLTLILLNYNSVRILSFALDSVKEDQSQRTRLIADEIGNEVSARLAEPAADPESLRSYLLSRVRAYKLEAVVLFGEGRKSLLKVGLSDDFIQLAEENAAKNFAKPARLGSHLIASSVYQIGEIEYPFVILFNIEKILRLERSIRLVTYLNFFFIAVSAILAFYFIESTIRSYRALMQTARSAHLEWGSLEKTIDSEFLIGTFRGVIDRLKEKEHELENLHRTEKARADDVEQLNQDLIGSISSGLILIDHSRKIRMVNDAAEHILRTPRKELMDASYDKMRVISPDFKADIDRCFAERLPINRAELEIVVSDQGSRHVGASIMPVHDRKQNFAGVFCLFTDITEIKQLQHLMAMKEKFASLGEMAAGVAHEFRNSVATISGYLQLMESRGIPEAGAYIVSMQREIDLLQKVVNDFLSFARPVQLQVQNVSLAELLEECLEEVKVSEGSKKIAFSMSGTFPKISGDEAMLKQVFTNLLRNAAQAFDGKSIDSPRVAVWGHGVSAGKYAIVEIRDNGSGIEPQALSKIFTPFFSTKQDGVGLGLAIVQKLVLQHNGTISVESTAEGSSFRVQLPFHE